MRISINSKGFTLIELLVAIFMLTTGIIAVLYMFPLGTRIGKSAEMITVATQLGQAKMEEIISTSYADILVGTMEPKQALPPPFSAYSRETEVNYYDPVNSTTTGSDSGIKMIKVTVSWEFLLGAYTPSIDIVSLISKR